MRSNPYAITHQVALADIVKRPGWQVRKGLSTGTVDRYAAIFKAGGDMDPVTLAQVGDVLVLIDGAHRMEALRRLGRDSVEATVTKMTEAQAEWAAASANLEHGQPLKKAELREVFHHYIATGQHRKGRGKVKSLREIARDIPGVTHGTVRNWLQAGFPDLYRKSYAGSGAEGHSHGGLVEARRPTQAELDLQATAEHIKQAAALVALMPRKAERAKVAKLVTHHLGPLLGESSPG